MKYVAFYDTHPEVSVRNISPAAVNKATYIAKCLCRSGFDVEIISAAWIRKAGTHSSELVNADGVPICFPPGLNYFGPFSGFLNLALVNVWLIWLLISKTRNGDKILVYHSLFIMPAITVAKLLKSLKIVLEVEEIYTSVGNWNLIMRYIEKLYVRTIGSFYILSTEMLEVYIPSHRLRICIYGSYAAPNISSLKLHGANGRVKLLYAGIIDKHKMGAFNAVRAAAYLGSEFEMHIVGFGDVEDLLLEIEKINLIGKCRVTYDGYISGVKFDEYCSGFDIGLSTQNSSGDYIATSFPSKILTYFSYGLRVVSPYIDCVARSAIGHLVNYYHSDRPVDIARSILSVSIDEGFSCATELKKLDDDFCRRLSIFFSE